MPVPVVLAVGLVAAAVNLWALVDALRRHCRDRAMWFSLTLAGFACGASTAPFLVPVAVYTAMAYLAAGREAPARIH